MILNEFDKLNYKLEQFDTYSNFLYECSKKNYDGIATHKHHILPKNMNGTNKKTNIIEIGLHDHYIAHYILAHCFEDGHVFKKNNLHACNLIIYHIRKYFKNNNINIPTELSEFWEFSQIFLKGLTTGKNNHFYGKKHTAESRMKIREARSKQVITDEAKAKMSLSSNNKKGELNPNFGKTFDEIHGLERSFEIKEKLKQRRYEQNFNKPLPPGIYKCDVVLKNIQKHFYRFCPACNEKIYYNGERSDKPGQAIRDAEIKKRLCSECIMDKLYQTHKPDRKDQKKLSNNVVIKDNRTNIIYDSYADAQRKLNLTNREFNKLVRNDTFIVVHDNRKPKQKNESRKNIKVNTIIG